MSIEFWLFALPATLFLWGSAFCMIAVSISIARYVYIDWRKTKDNRRFSGDGR